MAWNLRQDEMGCSKAWDLKRGIKSLNVVQEVPYRVSLYLHQKCNDLGTISKRLDEIDISMKMQTTYVQIGRTYEASLFS
ncbi:hypothetical protein H5410_018297 [Solanum commersonii]|uniref:Uncharacterized protein n=1 Tax=Solanum commersonii TaxID=4109 RepID=A0A9J6A1Q7_SOLCO|nr:hypothetical protein H5410_018297 [Solanum commersonii]